MISSSFLRHCDETKTLLNSPPQFGPIGADAVHFARADWTYTGRRFTGFHALLDNGAVNTLYNNLPPYHLVNLRAGVNAKVWRASIFVDNVLDARPIMQQQNYAPIPVTTRVTSKPRTYGATLSRNF